MGQATNGDVLQPRGNHPLPQVVAEMFLGDHGWCNCECFHLLAKCGPKKANPHEIYDCYPPSAC